MINLGTIGTSWITESFINAAKLSGELNFTAVYSRSPEKASQFAQKNGAPTFFTSLEEMAASPELDAVYIASPNSLHFEHAILFLQNKKHVICEKPIFSNSKELYEAFRVAEENDVFLMEAIRNIHAPNLSVLKKELHRAGSLRSAILPYIQYSSRYDLYLQGEEPNIFSAKFSGGALVDLGVYPLFLATAIFGEPESVTYSPVLLRSGVDGSGTLVLRYRDFVCTIMCSKTSYSELKCEIHGEKGTFFLEDAAPISGITFIDSHAKEKQSFGIEQVEQDMMYEAKVFAGMITTKNTVKYEEMKKLSTMVMRITEEARRQNNIVFATEKLQKS